MDLFKIVGFNENEHDAFLFISIFEDGEKYFVIIGHHTLYNVVRSFKIKAFRQVLDQLFVWLELFLNAASFTVVSVLLVPSSNAQRVSSILRTINLLFDFFFRTTFEFCNVICTFFNRFILLDYLHTLPPLSTLREASFFLQFFRDL